VLSPLNDMKSEVQNFKKRKLVCCEGVFDHFTFDDYTSIMFGHFTFLIVLYVVFDHFTFDVCFL
jgi:hypothetical protein